MRRSASSVALAGALLTAALVGCGGTAGTGTAGAVAPPSAAASASTPTAASTPSPSGAAATSSPSGPPVTHVASASVEPALALDWSTAGPGGAQPCTYSPAIDAKGRIWVAACWASRFWIFDPTGRFVEAWGAAGAAPGQLDFSYPASHDSIGGIAFAPDGTFYTFDAGNLRVQHFDAKRALLGSWGSFGRGDGQFAKPTSIAIAPDGTVLVGDGARNDVQVFSPAGAFVRTLAEGTAGARQSFVYLGVDKAGNVYVNGDSSVMKYAPDGTPLATFDLSAVTSSVNGIAIASNGDMVVLGRGDSPLATVLLSADGTLRHLWPGTGEAAVIGPGGALYVTDVESDHLMRFTLPAK